MRTVSKDEFLLEAGNFLDSIKKGAVFVYPTDTIYGIGCNAMDSKAVKRIRDIKKRQDAPFSVIAPSKKWIMDNCHVSEEGSRWIEKLPGPYTLVFRLKNRNCVAKEVIPDTGSLGVRIPNHWTSRIASEIDAPIVTTSVNETGRMFMTSLDNMDPSITAKIDLIIDEGEKKGKPSNVVFLDKEEITIRDRQKGMHYPEIQKI